MSEEKQMCKNHPDREAFVADVCYECLENSYAASQAWAEGLKLDQQPAHAEAAPVERSYALNAFLDDLATLSVSDAAQIDTLKAKLAAANEARLKAEADAAAMHELLERILEQNHQLISGECPWCGADEYPVDKDGNRLSPGDEETELFEWWVDHLPECPVTTAEKGRETTAGSDLLDKLATATKALEAVEALMEHEDLFYQVAPRFRGAEPTYCPFCGNVSPMPQQHFETCPIEVLHKALAAIRGEGSAKP